MRQAIVNLVGNAIKFTERGEVSVLVRVEDRAEDRIVLRFTICDTGIGIPADRQQCIFRPFEQADGSTTRKYGGTGLGLAITARLVELMGGRIWLESQPGLGSQFHFTAEFALPPVPAADEPEPLAALAGARVLLIEDNATARRGLEALLAGWQCCVTPVADAAGAILALQTAADAQAPFQLAICDATLPGINATELRRRLAESSALPRLPVVMLLSPGRPDQLYDECDSTQAICISKPVKPADLLAALAGLLGVQWNAGGNQSRPASQGETELPPLRVLLAEDGVVNQKLALKLLEKRGHSVTLVDNGREALAKIQASSFDVVLMDVQMPEMDGFAVTAAVRHQERVSGGHMPIVALTAHAMKGDRERCLEAGMDGYVSKPIRSGELFAEVAAVLAQSRAKHAPPEGLVAAERQIFDWGAAHGANGRRSRADARRRRSLSRRAPQNGGRHLPGDRNRERPFAASRRAYAQRGAGISGRRRRHRSGLEIGIDGRASRNDQRRRSPDDVAGRVVAVGRGARGTRVCFIVLEGDDLVEHEPVCSESMSAETWPVEEYVPQSTVLVVDDGPVDRRMVGKILDAEPSLSTVFADHGKQALEQIEASPPDVVLTDIQMPEMDGLTLVTEIRRRFPFLPVILMTAHGSEDTAIDALRQGAASYVPKRRLARDLIETIEGVLAAAQYGREQHRLFESWLHSEYSFRLDNDPALLGRMVAQAQQYLREQPGIDETTIIRIGVALHEALTNAMHHGNLELDSALCDSDAGEYDALLQQRLDMEPYRSRRIHVSIRETPEEGRYVIRDEGPGFNTASLVTDCTDPEHLERPYGRGLFLIRAFMDEVAHNAAGNEITMIHRHRSQAS